MILLDTLHGLEASFGRDFKRVNVEPRYKPIIRHVHKATAAKRSAVLYTPGVVPLRLNRYQVVPIRLLLAAELLGCPWLIILNLTAQNLFVQQQDFDAIHTFGKLLPWVHLEPGTVDCRELLGGGNAPDFLQHALWTRCS